MKKKVLELVMAILVDDYPDLLIDFSSEGKLQTYLDECWNAVELLATNMELNGVSPYIIESACLENIAASLPPSKFRLVKSILIREFYQTALAFDMKGLLTYEVLNLLPYCIEAFNEYPFDNNTEDSRLLEYYITGIIAEQLTYNPSLN